jgi:hypothetical protein
MQISIRTMLALVTIMALAAVAITTGGISAAIFQSLVACISLAAIITVFVGRGRARATAIGYAMPLTLYLAALIAIGKSEFDPFRGTLPTSRIARNGYAELYTPTYRDIQTGEILSREEVAKLESKAGFGFPSHVSLVEMFPDPIEFMATAHASFVFLFGLFGAAYAALLHRFQSQTECSS